MKNVRYLTFEINNTCPLARIHPKCPVSDPERYQFGETTQQLSNETILDFWRWARSKGFRGVVLWHLYNEPAMAVEQIYGLMSTMRSEASDQKFHLWTAKHTKFVNFDHIVVTNYQIVRPDDLDNRRAITRGEGNYRQAPQSGHCTRSYNWEVIIDFHGNWLRCCADWRCEDTLGNIFTATWDSLLAEYDRRGGLSWVIRSPMKSFLDSVVSV